MGKVLAVDLIPLLTNGDAEVVQVAHAVLANASAQDFGPAAGATPADREKARAAWEAWRTQQGKPGEVNGERRNASSSHSLMTSNLRGPALFFAFFFIGKVYLEREKADRLAVEPAGLDERRRRVRRPGVAFRPASGLAGCCVFA